MDVSPHLPSWHRGICRSLVSSSSECCSLRLRRLRTGVPHPPRSSASCWWSCSFTAFREIPFASSGLRRRSMPIAALVYTFALFPLSMVVIRRLEASTAESWLIVAFPAFLHRVGLYHSQPDARTRRALRPSRRYGGGILSAIRALKDRVAFKRGYRHPSLSSKQRRRNLCEQLFSDLQARSIPIRYTSKSFPCPCPRTMKSC